MDGDKVSYFLTKDIDLQRAVLTHTDDFNFVVAANFFPRSVGGKTATPRPPTTAHVRHQTSAVVIRGGKIGGVLPTLGVTAFR